MIGSKQLKVGMTILFRGELHRVLSVQHTAPGKGAAFVQAKLRNLKTGLQTENKYRSGEAIEQATLDMRQVQYLYRDGDAHFFMDTDNYEQFHLNAEILGDSVKFLVPNMNLQVQMHDATPLGVELPKTVSLKITGTEPYVKTATVTNTFKAATVETGATIQVPGFVEAGEVVDVDTETGKYVGRTKG